MALRSVLRKMPALGLRSPPIGPLMGPVRALSPAVGSRFMSDGVPINELENLMEEHRRELALSSASIDESMRRFRENHERLMKKFDVIEKTSWAVMVACPVAIALMIIA